MIKKNDQEEVSAECWLPIRHDKNLTDEVINYLIGYAEAQMAELVGKQIIAFNWWLDDELIINGELIEGWKTFKVEGKFED